MATAKQIEKILGGLVVVVDTREQRPFLFPNSGIQVVSATLQTGDYSIKGYEASVAIERKEYGDFLSCVARQRTRFMAEMERLASFRHRALVIETDYSSIAQGAHPHSKVRPSSAVGTIVRLVALGIPVVTAWDRKGAEDFTLRLLKRIFLTLRGVKV